MKMNGKKYIGVNSLKDEYIGLNLSMGSSEEDWNRAIEMFDDRIDGRFFDVINVLKNNLVIPQSGFSIMALDCLLIETLMQFKNGYSVTPKGCNKKEYTNFLKDEFPNEFPTKKIAELFYKDIRCGILHSAETKNGSDLTFNESSVIKMIASNKIRVDIMKITRMLESYYKDYIRKLNDDNCSELRRKFIEKMDFVCKIN